jgi:hypothetical protein
MVKMLFLKLKWSMSPALLNRLAICLGSSFSASKASTKFKRTKSAILTSKRHGAAIGCTGVAHASFVARPGIGAIDVNNADG